MKSFLLLYLVSLTLFSGCDLRFGAQVSPTAALTMPVPTSLVIVWVDGGDLYGWREDDPTARVIASGGVIQAYLSPGGSRVAFTRGAQGDARALWVVGTDGTGAQELVAPDVIPSIRNGHPQIDQVEWQGDEAVYFSTRQDYQTGSVKDDNLYRAALDADPQLILPPGAGGDFEISPNGERIAVVSAGLYDTLEGRVTLLDPLGVQVAEKLSFTALRAPDEPPFYPPLAWSAESDFVRVPLPNRENNRVALWRVPVNGEAQIFGYLSAVPEGLPVWGAGGMLYLQAAAGGGYAMILADASGENAQVYASGAPGSPRWLPDGEHFAYEFDGGLWLGQRDEAPQQLLEQVPTRIVFLNDGSFVYVAAGGLLRGFSDGGTPEVIAQLDAAAFDATLAR